MICPLVGVNSCRPLAATVGGKSTTLGVGLNRGVELDMRVELGIGTGTELGTGPELGTRLELGTGTELATETANELDEGIAVDMTKGCGVDDSAAEEIGVDVVTNAMADDEGGREGSSISIPTKNIIDNEVVLSINQMIHMTKIHNTSMCTYHFEPRYH